MWGQEPSANAPSKILRIIPMRVGTSLCQRCSLCPCWDHPHACGDKIACIYAVVTVIGSSPCVWGQAILKLELVLCARIIPMRVGTRFFLFSQTLFGGDHPHACGDKCGVACVNTNRRGSSPCVWGQVLDAWNTYKNDRIIPMRVGTSQEYRSEAPEAQDHPHACGDKKSIKHFITKGRGSSPCVWGQAACNLYDSYVIRIIPMRVGTSQRL